MSRHPWETRAMRENMGHAGKVPRLCALKVQNIVLYGEKPFPVSRDACGEGDGLNKIWGTQAGECSPAGPFSLPCSSTHIIPEPPVRYPNWATYKGGSQCRREQVSFWWLRWWLCWHLAMKLNPWPRKLTLWRWTRAWTFGQSGYSYFSRLLAAPIRYGFDLDNEKKKKGFLVWLALHSFLSYIVFTV